MVFTTVHDWTVPAYSSDKWRTLRCNYGVYNISGLELVDGVLFSSRKIYTLCLHVHIAEILCTMYCKLSQAVQSVLCTGKMKLCSASMFTKFNNKRKFDWNSKERHLSWRTPGFFCNVLDSTGNCWLFTHAEVSSWSGVHSLLLSFIWKY